MVSIIIPTYKGEKTVELAVVSALRQRDVEKEIIVVDDNGEDSESQRLTEQILHKYIVSNEIIYICHKRNMNGSAARNTGLKIARGEYITFIDDDDYIFPEKLKKQINILKKGNERIGICVTEGFYVLPSGVGYYKKIRRKENFLYNYLTDKIYFNTSAVVFEKKVLDEIDGFDERYKRHQDWELCARVLAKYEAVVINEPLMIRYIEGRNNPTNQNERINNLEFFIKNITPYVENNLTEKKMEKFKNFRRREICQSYIRACQINDAVKYARTYANFGEVLLAILEIPWLALRKMLFGMQKVTVSRKELIAIVMNGKGDQNE